MSEIDNLSIAISASASGAAKAVDSLAQKLGGLKSSVKDASTAAKDLSGSVGKMGGKNNAFTEFNKGAQKAKKNIEEVQKAAREPIKWFPDKESIKEAARSVKAVGEAFKEMASAATGAVGGLIKQMVKLSGSIAKASFKTLLNGVKLAARGLMSFTGHVLKLVGALGRLAASAAGAALSKLGSWAKSAAGGIASIVKQGTFLPLMFGKNLVQGIGGAVKSVGNLLKSFKRVVMYRALRSIIKEITQGFQEGLKNLYAWSRGVGGEFAASMNRIATATQYLRNSLGALASPLIESLAPAIDFVIDKFVALINIVNQFLARLGGKSTYIAAKKAAAQWDNAASHAGSAANAMKRYTLAFDELNILGKSSSGGSGGSGGSSSGAGGMFEERPIEGEVSSFADDIMAAFNTQDWARIGELLAGKFNEIIDSIPWPDIGDKIANGVNMAMGVAHSFLVETDFEGLGKDISDLFNHAVSNIDWDLMGRTAGEKFGAVLRTLTSLWEGIDFSVLGQRLSEAFNGYVDTVTTRISEIDWQWLGQKFSYGLNNLIGGIDWAALGDMLIAGFSSTIDLLLSAVETFDWVKAGKAVSTLFNKLWSYDWPGLVKRLKGAAKDVLDGLISTVSGFSWGDAKDTFYSTVAALFDENKFNTEPGGLGALLGDGINTALGVLQTGVSDFTWGTEIITAFTTEVNKLISKVDWFELGKTMQKLLGAAISMLKNTVVSVEWGTLGTSLATSLNGFFNGPDSKQMWSDIGDTFNAALNGALDFTINFVENFKVTDFAENVKTALGNVDWPGIARKVWDLFSKAALKLGNFITVLFGGDPDPKTINEVTAQIKDKLGKGNTARHQTELDKLAGDYDKSTAAQLGQNVNTVLSTFFDWVKTTLAGMPWEEWGMKLGQDAREFFGEIEWVELGTKVGNAIWEALKGLGLLLADAIAVAIYGEDYKNSAVWRATHQKQIQYEETRTHWSQDLAINARNPFEYSLTTEAENRLGGGYDRIMYDDKGNAYAMYDAEHRKEKLSRGDYTVTGLNDYGNSSPGYVRSWIDNFTNVGPVKEGLSVIGNGFKEAGSDFLGMFRNTVYSGQWKREARLNAGKERVGETVDSIKEFGSSFGSALKNSPLGKLFSNASEQAKTEKALLNQAQFLVSSGKSVKEVAKELGLNTKQQKKLTDAMGISPASAAFGYDNRPTSDIKWDIWGKNLGLSDSQIETVVDVIFQPEGNLQTQYKNQGLMDWLKKIFEPGVDTKTRVELIKNGWKTLPEFVGTNKVLTAYTELVKKITGQTPATLFGATLSVLSWLSRKNNGETSGSFFGTTLSVLSWLTRKNNGETTGSFYGATLSVLSWLEKKVKGQTSATEYGSTLSVFSTLSKADGSKDVKGLYGTTLGVTVTLSKKANNTLKWTAVDAQGNKQVVQFSKLGGAYHNGAWHDIPQYANGTVNAHGSLFLAGEAGPEIVGHVGGRTEVLNKSQLASAMFTSVRAAMSPAVEMFRGIGNSFAAAADRAMNAAIGMADALYTQTTGSYSGGYSASEAQSQDMDALLSLMRQESEATRQQNELLRQQNELLRQISEKDYSPSTAQLSRAFNRTNMRAGTTVIPVGT